MGNPSIYCYWDSSCQDPTVPECKADGVTQNCRYCGDGTNPYVPCPGSDDSISAKAMPAPAQPRQEAPAVGCSTAPAKVCMNPSIYCYWDSSCQNPTVPECKADGVTQNCRYCGDGTNPYVPCPSF